LARTNYQYGKRLRELAKKQKREEKRLKRKERKEAAAAGLTPEGENPDALALDADDDSDDDSDDDAISSESED